MSKTINKTQFSQDVIVGFIVILSGIMFFGFIFILMTVSFDKKMKASRMYDACLEIRYSGNNKDNFYDKDKQTCFIEDENWKLVDKTVLMKNMAFNDTEKILNKLCNDIKLKNPNYKTYSILRSSSNGWYNCLITTNTWITLDKTDEADKIRYSETEIVNF